MKKIDFRPEKKVFNQLGEALGMRTDWEQCAKIKLGKNGVNELYTDFLEVALLELELRDLGPLEGFFRRKVEIVVQENFGEEYDNSTALRSRNEALKTLLFSVMDNFNENLKEYGQDGAMRRLQLRKKALKSSNNGPRIYFKDKKEDEINDVGKT